MSKQEDSEYALSLAHAVTVRYDLSSVEHDAAIQAKLVELGWTPPGVMSEAVADLADACCYMSRYSTTEEWQRFHRTLERVRGSAK